MANTFTERIKLMLTGAKKATKDAKKFETGLKKIQKAAVMAGGSFFAVQGIINAFKESIELAGKFDNAATGATASARAQIKNLVSTSTETISFFTDRVYEMMTTKQFTYTGTLNRPIKRGFYIGDAVTYAESSTLGLLLNINEINNELLTEDFLRLVDESGNALVDELSIASSTVRYELLYAVTYNFLTEESERIIAEDSDAFVNETDYVAPIDFTDGQTIYFYDTNKTNFTPSATTTINSSPSTVSTTVGLNATDYGSIFNAKSSGIGNALGVPLFFLPPPKRLGKRKSIYHVPSSCLKISVGLIALISWSLIGLL